MSLSLLVGRTVGLKFCERNINLVCNHYYDWLNRENFWLEMAMVDAQAFAEYGKLF